VGSLPRVARRTVQQAITWSLFDIVSRSFGGNFLAEDKKK
jgi:solute carrier family 25, member 38